jgi:hypothetical protein
VVNYLLTMELNINAYAIVEADSEEAAKKKGADLNFDCNLSPVDNYGKIVSVYRIYNHYCRKKDFIDPCVKGIRNT